MILGGFRWFAVNPRTISPLVGEYRAEPEEGPREYQGSLPRLSGEYRAEPGEGRGPREYQGSLPRLSGEYRAEPGEGGEGRLNYSS
jgi:hypothetical protein